MHSLVKKVNKIISDTTKTFLITPSEFNMTKFYPNEKVSKEALTLLFEGNLIIKRKAPRKRNRKKFDFESEEEINIRRMSVQFDTNTYYKDSRIFGDPNEACFSKQSPRNFLMSENNLEHIHKNVGDGAEVTKEADQSGLPKEVECRNIYLKADI